MSLEIYDRSPQNVLDAVVQKARNGSIVLQHCNSQQTSIILQTEIERLERMGYEITTVTRVIQP